MSTATLKSGSGYWDTTHYPYGGAFRRTETDVQVTVIGPGGKYPKIESKIKFSDGRTGVVQNRFLAQRTEVL